MSEALTAPAATYEDILRRASEDHAAITTMALTGNLTLTKANTIASDAVTSAVEDWCHDNRVRFGDVPLSLEVDVMAALVTAGILEHERKQQLDIFEDQDIWRGAAAHEAREDLG